MIDRLDGRLNVGIAGKENPDAFGGALSHLPQKFHPVHTRHLTVGHDHCKGSALREGLQSFFRADRRIERELFSQLTLETLDNIHFIIDKEHRIAHVLPPMPRQVPPHPQAFGEPEPLQVSPIELFPLHTFRLSCVQLCLQVVGDVHSRQR